MTESLLALYWNLNLLLAFSFIIWAAIKLLSRWPRLQLGGNAQLWWARRIFGCAVFIALLIEFAPRWLSLMPWAQTLKANLIGEWTTIAGATNALSARDDFAVWQQYVLVALLAGWLWQATKLALQVRKLKLLVQRCAVWKQTPNVWVLVSPDAGVPFATKVLGKCHIVLPERLIASPSHWRLAAQHELQHARNGDLDWLLWLEALGVLCFWNPFMHAWRGEFDVLQELACDETLVAERSVDAVSYGHCLLEVAQLQASPALVGASAMVPLMRWFRNNNTLLRRRIMKLGKIRKEKNSHAKSLFYGILITGGLMSGSMLIAADAPLPSLPDASVRPLVRINPDYPPDALAQGAEGWVHMRFTIDAEGKVADAKVLESCAGPGNEPCIRNVPLFADAALKALSRWRYAGTGTARPNVETILRFQLQD